MRPCAIPVPYLWLVFPGKEWRIRYTIWNRPESRHREVVGGFQYAKGMRCCAEDGSRVTLNSVRQISSPRKSSQTDSIAVC